MKKFNDLLEEHLQEFLTKVFTKEEVRFIDFLPLFYINKRKLLDGIKQETLTICQEGIKRYFFLEFILNSIKNNYNRPLGYCLHDIVKYVYKDYSVFEEYLEDMKNTSNLHKEYNRFYNTLKENDYKPVSFDFSDEMKSRNKEII